MLTFFEARIAMKLDAPDILRTIDRTSTTGGGVLGSVGRATDAGALGAGRGRSFAAILNAQKEVAGQTASAAAPAAGGVQRAGETMTEFLNRQARFKTTSVADGQHAKAEKAAAGLVSNALILPVLKQLRRSSFGKNSVFSGGNGEKTFGPEFDMQLADRIAQSPNLGIRDALAAKMEQRGHAMTKTSGQKTNAKAAGRLDVNG